MTFSKQKNGRGDALGFEEGPGWRWRYGGHGERLTMSPGSRRSFRSSKSQCVASGRCLALKMVIEKNIEIPEGVRSV